MEGKDWALIVAAIFVGLTGLVSAVFSGLAALYAAQAKSKSDSNELSIHEVKHATDGMKDALVQAAGDKGFKAGVAGEANPTVQVDLKATTILGEIAKVPEKTAEKVVEKLKDV